MEYSSSDSPPILSGEVAVFRDRLRARSSEILNQWLDRRQALSPGGSPDRKSDRVWLDHLPDVLSEIIESLAPSDLPDPDSPRIHARQRMYYGFSAEDAVFDLHLLGALLREELRMFIHEHPEFGPDTGLRLSSRISEAIEALVLESARTIFVLRKREQRLREKIFKRKLEVLSEAHSETCDAVDGYSHDLKGCTDTLIRLTEVIRDKVGGEADPLLNALAVGLRYNHKILADLEALSYEDRELEFSEVDVAALVRDIWSRAVLPLHAAGVSRVEWFASDPVCLRTDALALERILSNLIDNAVQHGCSGQVIGMGWWMDSERRIRFELENQIRVEDPALDAGKPRTEEAPLFREGTGISVVRRLVENLDGDLEYRRVGRDRVRVRLMLAGGHRPKG